MRKHIVFYYNDFDGVKSLPLSHHSVILLKMIDFKKINSGNNKSVHNSNFLNRLFSSFTNSLEVIRLKVREKSQKT